MTAASRVGKTQPDTAIEQPTPQRPAHPGTGRDEPPYYIATQALYIGAARAHATGARVTPAHVAKHGWQDMVRRPDEPPAAADQPATDEGQAAATTKKKEG